MVRVRRPAEDRAGARARGAGVPGRPALGEYIARFADADGPSARAIILVGAVRISDSCGFAVPFMEYREERTQHAQHFARKSDEEFAAYCEKKSTWA